MNPPLDVMLFDIAQQQANDFPVDADTIMAASKALSRADSLINLVKDLMDDPTIVGANPQRSALIDDIKIKLLVWTVNYGKQV